MIEWTHPKSYDGDHRLRESSTWGVGIKQTKSGYAHKLVVWVGYRIEAVKAYPAAIPWAFHTDCERDYGDKIKNSSKSGVRAIFIPTKGSTWDGSPASMLRACCNPWEPFEVWLGKRQDSQNYAPDSFRHASFVFRSWPCGFGTIYLTSVNVGNFSGCVCWRALLWASIEPYYAV